MSFHFFRDTKWGRGFLFLIYAVSLIFFYYKYVPLVEPFQIILLPVLCLTAFLAWVNIEAGTLFFIFAFPLINNLPYFFGIYEPLPHAPTALVLFLFFFLGYLFRRGSLTTKYHLDQTIVKPITIFSLLVFVSGLITFFRFANFFPFLSPRIYDLVTNIHGTRSGGAVMSIIFQALNYLTGLAFFLIFLKILQSKKYLRGTLFVLCLSTFLSVAFAIFQHFGHTTLGNNPASIRLHLINGTFKDALSFGSYLSMAIPLFLGVFVAFPDITMKCSSFLVIVLSLFIIIFTGSKSGIISLAVATLGFIVFGIGVSYRSLKSSPAFFKKKHIAIFLVFILIVGITLTLFFFRNMIQNELKTSNIIQRFRRSEEMLSWRMNTLWKPALCIMRDYPLTGVGLGGFIIEVANYSSMYRTPEIAPESAENYILQIGSELGVIGIIIVLWIAWEILRQIRKGFDGLQKTADRKTKYLFIGAISGVIAFIINAQTHTYIGSYEIKYTLWLLVGLIFALPRISQPEHAGEEKKASAETSTAFVSSRKLLFNRRFKILAAALLLLYGAVHLWNSTHTLSLKSRTEKLGLKQEFGLDKLEKTTDGREFRWTGSNGGMTFKVEKPVIVLPLHAAHPDIQKKPVKVKIYLIKNFFKQKRLLKEITLMQTIWQNIVLSIPEEVGNEVILLIKVSRTWNPLKTLGTPDPRNLGVAVGRIEFRDK
jgi:hypothetical protein